jgi:hypothetical protein
LIQPILGKGSSSSLSAFASQIRALNDAGLSNRTVAAAAK